MLAFLAPTPDAVSAWVEALRSVWFQLVVPVAAGLAAAWLWLFTFRARQREERRKEEAARVAAEQEAADRAAEARAAREQRRAGARRVLAARAHYYHAGAEAARFLVLQLYGPRAERLPQEEQDSRAAILMHELVEARADLWRAEGRPDPREDPAGAAEARAALRSLTVTQRFAPPLDLDDVDLEGDHE